MKLMLFYSLAIRNTALLHRIIELMFSLLHFLCRKNLHYYHCALQVALFKLNIPPFLLPLSLFFFLILFFNFHRLIFSTILFASTYSLFLFSFSCACNFTNAQAKIIYSNTTIIDDRSRKVTIVR